MLGAMATAASKPSAVIDTRVIYCGDNLEQLRKLPDACVDLIYPLLSDKVKAAVCDPSLNPVCSFGFRRNVPVDLARRLRHRAAHHGW
jgi:hypothetical protein